MKLVVLTAAYPSAVDPGRAIFVESLTRAIAARVGPAGTVAVVTPRVCSEDPEREARDGIEVRRFWSPTGGQRLKEIPRPSARVLAAHAAAGVAALISEVRRTSAEVILCHWVLPSGPIGCAAGAITGLPIVLAAHGSDLNDYAARGGALGLAARCALGAARRVVAVSRALARRAIELGASAERVRVIPMGPDDERFGPGARSLEREEARRRLAVPAGRTILLFVGDLIEAKGLRDLVTALRRRTSPGQVECVLVGDGPLRPELEQEAGRCSLRLAGRLPQAQVACWMRAADLLVLPSHTEGAPVSILEALSLGLPVLASRIGGIPELIEEGRNGWLVPPRSPDALHSALEALLERPELLARARAAIGASPPVPGAAERGREYHALLAEVLRGV